MALNRRRITWREHFYSKSSVKRHKNLACGDAHKDIFYPYMGEAHSRNRLRLMAASVSRISPGKSDGEDGGVGRKAGVGVVGAEVEDGNIRQRGGQENQQHQER